jgi:glycosyltransferase involved in cell wall biosynthesis
VSAQPAVSFIVPAFNAEKFLVAALQSILSQSGAALDVIVIDDGSTDHTAEIAAGFDARVRVVRQENAGPAVSRNRGLAAARGEFIAFLDADDLCAEDKLKKQLLAFAQDPALGICAAHVQNFRGGGLPEGDPVPGYGTEMLIRREVFDRIGAFTSGLQHAARLEWILRARRAGVRERLLPEVLMYRRLHETNISYLHANQSLREHLKVLHASLQQRG